MNEETHIEVIDLEPEDYKYFIASFIVVNNNEAVIIETGPKNTVKKLIEFIKKLKVKIRYVIVTHIHLDHAGAVGTLIKYFPEAKIYVHPRGAYHLINPLKLWQASQRVLGRIATEVYGEPDPVPRQNVASTDDEMILKLGHKRFKILHTPGHASHHQTVFLENDSLIFTGDSAGMYFPDNIYIPSTPPPFKLSIYVESLKKMLSINPKRIAFTHFGIYDNAISYFNYHLSQIRMWTEIIRKNISLSEMEILRKISQYDININMLMAKNDIRLQLTVHSIKGIKEYVRKNLK